MTIKELSLCSLVAALVLSSACVVDDDPGQDTDTDTNPSTMSASASMTETMTDPTVGTTTTNSTDPDTTDTETDTTADTDADTDTDTDTEGNNPNDYMFRDDDPSSYTQVDRMGFPAVNTALIAAENKDAYNASNPAADIDGTYGPEAQAAIIALHGTAVAGLEDDIQIIDDAIMADLPAFCGAVIGNDSCIEQTIPLAFPDVLLLRTGAAAGFPNGRHVDTPVIDVILSAMFFELTAPDILNTFSLLPGEADGETHGLSQSPNDVEFPGAFPYLAPAHE